MGAIGRGAVCFLAAAVLGTLFPEEAIARPRTYVTHNCQGVKTRPRSILFACADGGYYVKRLRWRSWRTWRAVGRGAFHFNDCDLTCVDGTFHKRKGRLILRRRLWCPSISKYVFKRAEIRYRRPWQGDRRYSWRLSCPF
jgi:hypothetical protein